MTLQLKVDADGRFFRDERRYFAPAQVEGMLRRGAGLTFVDHETGLTIPAHSLRIGQDVVRQSVNRDLDVAKWNLQLLGEYASGNPGQVTPVFTHRLLKRGLNPLKAFVAELQLPSEYGLEPIFASGYGGVVVLEDEARKDEARKDEARKDEARKDEARKDEARKDEARKEQDLPAPATELPPIEQTSPVPAPARDATPQLSAGSTAGTVAEGGRAEVASGHRRWLADWRARVATECLILILFLGFFVPWAFGKDTLFGLVFAGPRVSSEFTEPQSLLGWSSRSLDDRAFTRSSVACLNSWNAALTSSGGRRLSNGPGPIHRYPYWTARVVNRMGLLVLTFTVALLVDSESMVATVVLVKVKVEPAGENSSGLVVGLREDDYNAFVEELRLGLRAAAKAVTGLEVEEQ